MIKLIDILRSTQLFEMAYRKSKAEDKIRELSHNVSIELLKILMYKDSKNQEHWRGKINGWLNDISDFSNIRKSKRLSKSIIFDLMFNEPLEEITQLQQKIKRVENEYYGQSRYIDYNNIPQLHLDIKNIYGILTDKIYGGDYIDINSILNS